MSIASQVFAEVAAMHKAHSEAVSGRLVMTEQRFISSDEEMLAGVAAHMGGSAVTDVCALAWVAPDMVDLLRHAAMSLPEYTYQRSVLPWPKAIVFGAKPFLQREAPITAFQWMDWIAPKSPNASVIVALSHQQGPDVLTPYRVLTPTPGDKLTGLTDTDDAPPDARQVRNAEYARVLCTLWLLLQQRVAVQRKAIPSRGERRRWIREEQGPLPEVTIIELRRPLNTEPFKGESGFVDWSHRWIVDGHWRNQYHPSTQAHVPTWIAPYVKGPDDKPLVVSRKVHAWTR